MFTAWLYQLGDTGGLRGGPAAGGELACGQSALQLFVRELLRPAGLLDVDVAVGRLPLLVEHGELAGQGPDDGMEAVEVPGMWRRCRGDQLVRRVTGDWWPAGEGSHW